MVLNRTGGTVAQTGMDPGGAERTDADVLAAVAGQDRGALRVLYERHEPWITVRIARRCADRQIVEEVVQDTFGTQNQPPEPTAQRYGPAASLAPSSPSPWPIAPTASRSRWSATVSPGTGAAGPRSARADDAGPDVDAEGQGDRPTPP